MFDISRNIYETDVTVSSFSYFVMYEMAQIVLFSKLKKERECSQNK